MSPDIEIFEGIEQGSEEWRRLRAGLPTASVFGDLLAKPRKEDGGMRIKLLRTLAGERITGEPAESYSNGYMERGKRLEAEARNLYAMLTDEEVRQVSFIRRPNVAGCSPDSLVGDDGGLEIKTATAAIMIGVLERDTPPPEHIPQVQGTLWVTGRSYWDLMIYQGKKMRHRVFRLTPDLDYFARLDAEVARFNADLDAIVRRHSLDDVREAA